MHCVSDQMSALCSISEISCNELYVRGQLQCVLSRAQMHCVLDQSSAAVCSMSEVSCSVFYVRGQLQ